MRIHGGNEMRKTLAILLLGITGWVAPGAARADFVYANTTAAAGTRLIGFDSSTPGTILSNVPITGVVGELVGIDFRTSNSQLIGVGNNAGAGAVYRINPITGVATAINTGAFTLTGTSFGVDINPVPDALRIVSNTGQNLRITGLDNANAVVNTDTALSATGVVDAAYTPNVNNTTTLFVLQDNATTADMLFTVNPPNAGTLTNPAPPLTINVSQLSGFDINNNSAALQLGFLSWNGGNQFGTLNLTTGAAVNNGQIGGGFAGQIAGIALAPVPEPASIALVGMGGVLLAGWLRKRSS